MKTFLRKMVLLAAVTVICRATVHAQTAPVITNQPVGAVVNLGDSATLSAGVSGTGVDFQWLKDGVIVTNFIDVVKLAELTSQGIWMFDRTAIVICSRIAAL